MRVKITDLYPYDGEHDCGAPFTLEEIYTFKRIAGIRPTEYQEALETRDVGLVVALTIVALTRKDHAPINELLLWKSELGKIMLDFSDEDDAVPPPEPNGSSPTSSGEPSESSGTSGNETGDSPPESDQSATGTPSPDDTA
jgi:hypothetical protein